MHCAWRKPFSSLIHLLFTSSNKLICQEYDAYQQFMCPVSLMPAKCFFFYVFTFLCFYFPASKSKLHFCFVLSSCSCFLVLLGLCLHHEMTDLGMRWAYCCQAWAPKAGGDKTERAGYGKQTDPGKEAEKKSTEWRNTKGKDSDHSRNFCPPSVLKCTYWSEKSLFFSDSKPPNFLVVQLYTFDLILGFKNTEWQGKLYKNH